MQLLISTINDNLLDKKKNISYPHLIINQLINIENSQYKQDNIFSYKERGLSKSRNRAIEHCSSDIALICDDDVIYLKDIENIITTAFNNNPKADIITFQFLKDEKNLYKKNYKKEKFWHDIYSLARVSSVEIAFRVNKIKSKNIKYDEHFGLGSAFPTGEEYIFLTDALKNDLKILYLPIPILIHPDESSGGQFVNNPLLIESKGALFYRIFGVKSYFITFLFALKKYKAANITLVQFYKLMFQGIKKYKKLKVSNGK